MTTKSRRAKAWLTSVSIVAVIFVTGCKPDSSGGTEIISDSDGTQVMTTYEDASLIQGNCTAKEVLTTFSCDGTPVLPVNARKMPFIARNVKLAWESGLPALLTMNRSKQKANRDLACPASFPTPHGGQCDEYPMAATNEGGSGARTEEVPARENQCQGGSFVRRYPKDGKHFVVVIQNPDQIASGPFTGKDIAKDRGSC